MYAFAERVAVTDEVDTMMHCGTCGGDGWVGAEAVG